MPQIKKPDDLQLIANLIRFFSYERRLLSTMEITKNSLAVNLTVRSWLSLVEQHRLFGKGSFFTRKKPACQRTRGRELKSKQ